MARRRGVGSNKLARVMKNKELIGKGQKQTIKEILAKGKSKGAPAKIKEIIKQGPNRAK